VEERGAETGRKCPPHWWIVDEKIVGICKYCGLKRDFGKLQQAHQKTLSEKQAAIGSNAHRVGKTKGRKRKDG